MAVTCVNCEFRLLNHELYTIQQDGRIGVFYEGGPASAGISVMIDRSLTDPFDGVSSQRIRCETGWLYYDTGEDLSLYDIKADTHG